VTAAAHAATGQADHLHRSFIRQTQMQTVEPLPPQDVHQPRQYTFHKGKEELPYSRIDDVYINMTAQQVDAAQICVHTRSAQDTSDHDMLIADIPYDSINLLPPLPPLQKPGLQEDEKKLANASGNQISRQSSRSDKHWKQITKPRGRICTPSPKQ
jgi:hypothetical protein